MKLLTDFHVINSSKFFIEIDKMEAVGGRS